MTWDQAYFSPRAEQATLYGNDVGYMPEAPARIPNEKIVTTGRAQLEAAYDAIRTKRGTNYERKRTQILESLRSVIEGPLFPDEVPAPFAARWLMRRTCGMGLKPWQVVCVSMHRCRTDAERLLAERNRLRGKSGTEHDMQECQPGDADYPAVESPECPACGHAKSIRSQGVGWCLECGAGSPWPEFASEVAKRHSLRDDACECGACRFQTQ